MRLTKHHGLGNDFLVLIDLDGATAVSGATASALCDRHRGIGADGLLWVTSGAPRGDRLTDVTMVLLNADGGRAEMSGNGISCLAQAVVRAALVDGTRVTVSTDAGVRTVDIERSSLPAVDMATVDMGPVKVSDDDGDWGDVRPLHAARVDVGNPHLVLHVADGVSDDDLVALGTRVNDLVPGGINVELVTGPAPNELTMQVYERGVGLTEACGTGACAAAAAAQHWGLVGPRVRVHQPGGPADIALGATVELTIPVVHVADIEVAS